MDETWIIGLAAGFLILWAASSFVDLEGLSARSVHGWLARARSRVAGSASPAVSDQRSRERAEFHAFLEEYASARAALGAAPRAEGTDPAFVDSDTICRLAHAFALGYARYLAKGDARDAGARFASSAAELAGAGSPDATLAAIEARLAPGVADPVALRELSVLVVFTMHERIPDDALDAVARRFVLAHVRLGLSDAATSPALAGEASSEVA